MEGIKIRTTKGDIEEFKKSILWADIIAELESWKEGFELEMKSIVDDTADNNSSTAAVLLHMGDLNGRAKAVDYMISIPEVFLSILESKMEDKKDVNKRK